MKSIYLGWEETWLPLGYNPQFNKIQNVNIIENSEEFKCNLQNFQRGAHVLSLYGTKSNV